MTLEAIKAYPDGEEITLKTKAILEPLFKEDQSSVSEFTFANIYLFRKKHGYLLSKLSDNTLAISGSEAGKAFLLLPFGLPEAAVLVDILKAGVTLKCITEEDVKALEGLGVKIQEDRDNFDYIYLREELSELKGGKFLKKRNRASAFTTKYNAEAVKLDEDRLDDALTVLDKWHEDRLNAGKDDGDYHETKEALHSMKELGLMGCIYYADKLAVAFEIGEALGRSDTFAVHFEKGLTEYSGVLQYVVKSFASLMPSSFKYINREQDLGIPSLRRAKELLRPIKFIKKYRVSL
ncbi:MAG: DUF2156 domain-containing protein [Deltaproteobacteria bacterium]|nr:DUF2156 domain-containing protein [Deltaproteobacteria bacterium]